MAFLCHFSRFGFGYSSLKVQITGGRKFKNYKFVCNVLDFLHKKYQFTLLVHGAARGADRLSQVWAKTRKVPFVAYPADWEGLGLSAGPIRNQEMLDMESPDILVAFPGGVGTADMVDRSIRFGVKIIEDWREKQLTPDMM